ncbi:unnamed protein product, partial [Effrenium voratum]
SWAAENGIQVGDEVMALDGRAVADFAEGAASGDLDGGLRGPRRMVLRFWATQDDLKVAVRTAVLAKPLAQKRLEFQKALRAEGRRFAFREALQRQLAHWRARDTWPLPGLALSCVDCGAELAQLLGQGHQGDYRGPRIGEMEAAARKLQAMFRWRKLWKELDTSEERRRALERQAREPKAKVQRRGLAAQLDISESEEEVSAEEAAAASVLEAAEEPDEKSEEEAPVVQLHKSQPGEAPGSPLSGPQLDFLGDSAADTKPSPRAPVGKVKLHKTLPGSAGLYDEPDTAPEASASPASPADAAPSARGFLDDAALEAAAVRIQAVQRGRQGRKQAKAKAARGRVSDRGPDEALEVDQVEGHLQAPALSFMGAEVDLDPRGRGLEVGSEASTPAFPLEVLVPEAPKEETSRVEPETARSLFGMALGAEVAEAPVAVEQVEAPVEMAPAAPSTPRAAPFAVAEAEAPIAVGGFMSPSPAPFDALEVRSAKKDKEEDEPPQNRLDFLHEEDATLVPQRLKLPRPKKKNREEKVTLAAPSAPSASAPAAPAASAAFDLGPKPAPAPAAGLFADADVQVKAQPKAAKELSGADALGASPRAPLQAQGGFRLPKGEKKDKEEKKEKKEKKEKDEKKKKKKKKEESDLDGFGLSLF